MKVQFLWPNFDCPIGLSIGLSYLAGALRDAGHETKITHVCEWLDYPFDIDRIESDFRAFNPDLIAFSTGANHYPEARRTAERLKKSIDKPILFGGVHTTLNTQAVMQDNPYIDFANVGEGDDSILDLVRALETGSDTTQIPNIWARKDGTIVPSAARPLRDLTTLPWMDLEKWEFKRISENRRGWVNVYMNRGCPYRCTYCHNNGVAKILQNAFRTPTSSNADLGYLRLRSIDDMIGELKSILDKYDFVSAFSFNDDTFTMDQEHMKAFLTAQGVLHFIARFARIRENVESEAAQDDFAAILKDLFGFLIGEVSFEDLLFDPGGCCFNAKADQVAVCLLHRIQHLLVNIEDGGVANEMFIHHQKTTRTLSIQRRSSSDHLSLVSWIKL